MSWKGGKRSGWYTCLCCFDIGRNCKQCSTSVDKSAQVWMHSLSIFMTFLGLAIYELHRY